jgi:hypothetical protein
MTDLQEWAAQATGRHRRLPFAPIPAVSMENGDWCADPLGRFKYRWLVAGIPTRFVSADSGEVPTGNS